MFLTEYHTRSTAYIDVNNSSKKFIWQKFAQDLITFNQKTLQGIKKFFEDVLLDMLFTLHTHT